MDIVSIGAALAVTEGAAASATSAATEATNAASAANTAAGDANTAKTAANNAATSANSAAAAANAAAANYSNLDKDAFIDRNAFNLAYTTMQAEIRNLQKRLTAAEAALSAMQ